MSGTAAPGTRIEVANLSTAPTGHLSPHGVVEVEVADANGPAPTCRSASATPSREDFVALYQVLNVC